MRPGRSRISGCSEPPTAADAEQGHAAGDAGLDQRQRQGVAIVVVRFVPGIRLDAEACRMNIGPRARQQDSVDRFEERLDIRDIRRARKHQRQCTGDLRDRP